MARNEAHKWSRIGVCDRDGHSIYDAGAGIIPANGRQRRTQRPVSSQDWPPTTSFKLQPGNQYNLGGEDHENIQIVSACSVGLGSVGFDARFRLSGGWAGASAAGRWEPRMAPK